jgi:hypothetical protein
MKPKRSREPIDGIVAQASGLGMVAIDAGLADAVACLT